MSFCSSKKRQLQIRACSAWHEAPWPRVSGGGQPPAGGHSCALARPTCAHTRHQPVDDLPPLGSGRSQAAAQMRVFWNLPLRSHSRGQGGPGRKRRLPSSHVGPRGRLGTASPQTGGTELRAPGWGLLRGTRTAGCLGLPDPDGGGCASCFPALGQRGETGSKHARGPQRLAARLRAQITFYVQLDFTLSAYGSFPNHHILN